MSKHKNRLKHDHLGFRLRKGCRTSKFEAVCRDYDYSLLRCRLGRVKATCPRCQQPKPNTVEGKLAAEAREFYSKGGV